MSEKEKQLLPFGDRIRDERARLDFDQQRFADAAGVTVQSQRNYEAGRRAPDAEYLKALAAAGADVQYILTGVRSMNLGKVAEDAAGYNVYGSGRVSREEEGILEMYRELRPGDRAHARAVIDALASKGLKKDETG